MDPQVTEPPAKNPRATEPKPGISQRLVVILTLVIVVPATGAVMHFLNQLLPGKGSFIFSCAILAAFGILRLYRMFFKAQSRLSEWLLATIVAAALMAVLTPLADKDLPTVVTLGIICISWSFCGAAWAWHAARRMQVTDSRQRAILMVKGWLCVTGVYILMFMLFSNILLTHDSRTTLEKYSMYLLFGSPFLCWPAVNVELACRKCDKELTEKLLTTPAGAHPAQLSPGAIRIGQLITLPVMWLIGPLIVHANSWIAAARDGQEVELDALPENVATFFKNDAAELQDEGFVPVVYADLGKRAQHTFAWIMLLRHRDNGDLAVSSVLDTRTQKFSQVKHVLGIIALAGERELGISNRDDAAIFPLRRGKEGIYFPDAKDLRALCRIHRAWTVRQLKGVERTSIPTGEEFARFKEIDRTAIEMLKQHGLMFMDSGGNHYRPTWKGACLMTWKMLWPWKGILHAQQRQKSAALCNELGLPYPS